MSGEVCLVLTTFPEAVTAKRVARTLVEENLTACANIISAIESVYHWQGKIEEGAETLTIFKLTLERYSDFAKRLTELHPYDVPEILRLAVDAGNENYLRWVAENCVTR